MAQITYTNKETLNEQPSIAAKNKVTSDDMNEIKTVVNTNYGEVGDITTLTTTDKTNVVSAVNELKSGEVYSTSETLTNKVWTDGKPIYRKVVTGTTTTRDANFTVAHGISNYDNIMIDGKSFLKTVGAKTLILPANCPANNSTDYNKRYNRVTIEDSNLIMYIGSYNGYNSFDYYIILEYTKNS